jgi:hypothetical protein
MVLAVQKCLLYVQSFIRITILVYNKININQNVNLVTHSHDVALIELNVYMTFNDAVYPVMLPENTDNIATSSIEMPVFVAGWGTTGLQQQQKTFKDLKLSSVTQNRVT